MIVKSFKISTFIVLFSVVIISFHSCEKEITEPNVSNQSQSEITSTIDYQLPPALKASLKKENGLIIFEYRQQFDEITSLLMSETEKHIDSFFSQFDENACVDEVNDIVDEAKFNPDVVFEAFESYHSIKSLRAKLKSIEDDWLNNEELIGENPSIYPISERCLAIANTDGEYQIGTTIYRVEKSGVVYEVKNQDYDALLEIRSTSTTKLKSTNPNVIIHRPNAASDLKSTMGACKAYIRRTKTVESGDRRMEMILDLDWDGWGSAAKAKTQSYRKKKFLGITSWGREWCGMSAQVYINDYDINCGWQGSYNSGIKYNSWAYYVSAHVYKSGTGLRTKEDWAFWGGHSNTHISTQYLSAH